MKEIIKMLGVLTLICGVCGFLLATVRSNTKEQIEEQVLLNVKGPAVKNVLSGSTNDLIKDRKKVTISGKEMILFVGKKDGEVWSVAYELSSGGFGGDIGVMMGFNLTKDMMTGIGITTHKETPGLGSRIAEEGFTDNFRDKPLTETFKIGSDGGIIDAVSGATISSRGVCAAVSSGIEIYKDVKSKVTE